ncbi:MAG: RDD family protein [Bryobacteraceae bacterium]
MGSAVRAVEQLPGPAPVMEREEPEEQPSLFPFTSKIIPIPTLTPVRAEGPTPRKARAASARGARKPSEHQRSLEFEVPATPPLHGLGTSVEAVIFCDAPVALPTHRILAAAIDLSMVLVAVGLFLGVFFLAGGEMVLNKQTVPLLGGAVVLFAGLYHVLWCLGNGDTIGMRAAQLRLVDFDGRTPTRSVRALRMGMSIISFCSAGLGLLWALVDEESLTWHDHATKTFPTLDTRR